MIADFVTEMEYKPPSLRLYWNGRIAEIESTTFTERKRCIRKGSLSYLCNVIAMAFDILTQGF